jgi:hypothetical protein
LLPIFEVALAGIDRMVRRLPCFLSIYWLPWLLGTIVLVILEVVVQDQLRLGRVPDWARNIAWVPFAAMTYLMLLRWVLRGDAPVRAINLDLGWETWVATPIVAAWLVANVAIGDAPKSLLVRLMLPSDLLAFRWEDVAIYYYAFQIAAGVANGVLSACFLGLVAIVAQHGRPDLRELGRLLRLQPVRLLCISLLAAAAVGGAIRLCSQALAWLGVDRLAPEGMIPWRVNAHWAFIAELPYFPLHFLEFAIQGCILAEAYRRLLLSSDFRVHR